MIGLAVITMLGFGELVVFYYKKKKYYSMDNNITEKSWLRDRAFKFNDIVEIYKEWMLWSGYCYRLKTKDNKKIYIPDTVIGIEELIETLKEKTAITEIKTGL